jgi:phosphoserine phosphatase
MKRIKAVNLILLFMLCSVTLPAWAQNDSLPSWKNGPSKNAITAFVKAVTDTSSPDFVQPGERIAVFDNDGTLWSEQPVYFQLYFAMDRVKELVADHPEWKTRQPFQAALEGDMKGLVASGEKGLIELVMATHAGMSTNAFTDIVKNWLQTARHPTLKKPYTELVFRPMLELLDYLRANNFKTFIISGGGIEFMRPWTEEVYGIPPEQVVGSSIVTKFKVLEGKAVLIREPKLNFIDDKAGKPVGINQHIGRRPIFAFGNSDGDLQMLQYTTLGTTGRRFAGIVHHTDGVREFSYDRDSHVGRLDKALTEAELNGWTVVDMKKEWKVIYP